MVFINIILKYAAYFKPSLHDPDHCSQQKCLYFIHICAYQRSCLTIVSKAAAASVFAWPSFIFLHSRYKYVSACFLSDSPLWTRSSRKTETLLLLIALLLLIMSLFAKKKQDIFRQDSRRCQTVDMTPLVHAWHEQLCWQVSRRLIQLFFSLDIAIDCGHSSCLHTNTSSLLWWDSLNLLHLGNVAVVLSKIRVHWGWESWLWGDNVSWILCSVVTGSGVCSNVQKLCSHQQNDSGPTASSKSEWWTQSHHRPLLVPLFFWSLPWT